MASDDVTVSFHVPAFLTHAFERIPFAQTYLHWWISLWRENPVHLLVETALILFILYILVKRPSKKTGKVDSLPPSVAQDLIDEFTPEPLCPPLEPGAQLVLEDTVTLEERPGKYTRVRGSDKRLLNMATMDFLGLGQRKETQDAAAAALDKYGCGSCGPRGFYGSIDVHVYLERDLARFFGTEETIVYSDATSAASSAIPAFSNRADLLVVDDGVNDAILTGVNLSRSRVLFFKHNDAADLERQLQRVADEDKRLKRKPQRRFVVVEGLYRNFGDICPLDEVVALKNRFKWRLFVDESHALGVLGANGRGAHEHFGVAASELDLLVGALSTTLGSVGGFCAGTREVVEHQRLSGAGYCFSASSPPFVSTAASAAIKLLQDEGKAQLMPALKRNAQFFFDELRKRGRGACVPVSDRLSALVHVRVVPERQRARARGEYTEEQRCAEERVLRAAARALRAKGVLATVSNYIISADAAKQSLGGQKRPPLPPPSLRLVVTALQEEKELADAAHAVAESVREALANEDNDGAAPVDGDSSDDAEKPVERPGSGLRARRA